MKWEYRTIFIYKDQIIDEPLNDYGEHGWEVYHVEFDRVIPRNGRDVQGQIVMMKRPKAQGETP